MKLQEINKSIGRWGFCFILFLSTTSISIAQIDTGSKSSKTQKSKKKKTLLGTASFYNDRFNGKRTANGDVFNQKKMTAACNKLPLGTWVKVTNLQNHKVVEVRINDRLHRKMTRLIDLSKTAAKKLDFISKGVTRVKVEVIPPPKNKKISPKKKRRK